MAACVFETVSTQQALLIKPILCRCSPPRFLMQALINHCQIWISRLTLSLSSITYKEARSLETILTDKISALERGNTQTADALDRSGLVQSIAGWKARVDLVLKHSAALSSHKVIPFTLFIQFGLSTSKALLCNLCAIKGWTHLQESVYVQFCLKASMYLLKEDRPYMGCMMQGLGVFIMLQCLRFFFAFIIPAMSVLPNLLQGSRCPSREQHCTLNASGLCTLASDGNENGHWGIPLGQASLRTTSVRQSRSIRNHALSIQKQQLLCRAVCSLNYICFSQTTFEG